LISRINTRKYELKGPLLNKRQSRIFNHGHKWLRERTRPPLANIKEVDQAKLREERTRRARELNLKIKGLCLPLPSLDPRQVGTVFLLDNLDLSDITLESDWFGTNSTLFIRFKSLGDRIRALEFKRKLFSLPNKIFLDEDLTRSQVAEIKDSKELVTTAQQAKKSTIIHNLMVVIRNSPPLGYSKPGISK
jgi:hypothetical protein